MSLFHNKKSTPKASPAKPLYTSGQVEQRVKVHTLPEKFLLTAEQKSPTKSYLLIGAIGFVLIIVVGVVTMYVLRNIFSEDQQAAPIATINQANTGNINSINGEIGSNANTASNRVVQVDVQNDDQKVIGSSALIIPEGALDSSIKVGIVGIPPDRKKKDLEGYNVTQVLGGVYSFTPDGLEFNKAVTLILSYTDEELKDLSYKENDLRIGFGEEYDNWELISASQIDNNKKTVSVMLKEFIPKGKYGIISSGAIDQNSEEENENENANTNSNTNESLSFESTEIMPSSKDTDNDLLTDVEEDLYGTTRDMPDTDSDGFIDGDELQLLFDPLVAGGASLKSCISIESYTNTSFGYSVLHPKKWVAKSVGDNHEKAYFTSATGEFVQIEADENPSELTPTEWYAEQSPEIDTAKLESLKIGVYDATKSIDGRSMYIAANGKIFTITYSIGLRKDMNFYSTFLMMTSSFSLSAPVGSSENSVSNTNAKPAGSNANQNTNAVNQNSNAQP